MKKTISMLFVTCLALSCLTGCTKEEQGTSIGAAAGAGLGYAIGGGWGAAAGAAGGAVVGNRLSQ